MVRDTPELIVEQLHLPGLKLRITSPPCSMIARQERDLCSRATRAVLRSEANLVGRQVAEYA